MTNSDVKKLTKLAENKHVAIESQPDEKRPNHLVVIIDGFLYDDPELAAADLTYNY